MAAGRYEFEYTGVAKAGGFLTIPAVAWSSAGILINISAEAHESRL